MSRVILARNVNEALISGIWLLKTEGVQETSRNGPVLVAPGLVVTEYTRPTERVLFSPKRDCNHVFHLMEAIWMLAGRNDVAWLEQFNSGYARYADAGVVHGAYGHRWRKNFGIDQLPIISAMLKKDPLSRQAVLQMWDFDDKDLDGDWKDRPCNTHVYFDCRNERLNMTVCCRSNDMLWGAYGANVVHFSILQEVLAAEIGVPVGVYRQMSNNFHVYTDLPMVTDLLSTPPTRPIQDLYDGGIAKVLPFVSPGESLKYVLEDCERFCRGERTSTCFLFTVAAPLRDAYLARKRGVVRSLGDVPDCDWKIGYESWLRNRSTQ